MSMIYLAFSRVSFFGRFNDIFDASLSVFAVLVERFSVRTTFEMATNVWAAVDADPSPV
jgi:hypothetical protein